MRLQYAGIVLAIGAIATIGFADTITMKNGRVINGTYLGGTARQVKVEVNDDIQTLNVSDVARIEFSGGMASAPQRDDRPTLRRSEGSVSEDRPTLRRSEVRNEGNVSEDRPTLRRSESNVLRPAEETAPPPAPRSEVELPAGTNLVVRMIEAVDSETARVGQTFAASLDQPVMLNGETVIPRGADVSVKLVDSKESGKLTGRAELALSLMSVRVNGRMVDINTQNVNRESSSRGEKTAKVAGGTAAVGAIIGAIAGGGKGAAIGAGAGAAAGAGSQVITQGQTVRIPSETRLTFVLDNNIRL
jgi:hypothetical protein